MSEFYEAYWRRPGGSPADFGFLANERQDALRNALASIPNDTHILDAGCGNGAFSKFMTELGYHVSGIDIAEAAISRAIDTLPNDSYLVASIEQGLPFRDNEFSAIWFTEVLEHVFNTHAALAELNRILQRNGLLVLTTPYHGLTKNVLIALFGFEQHYNPYISHIRFFTRQSLTACLERAGFQVTHWAGMGRRWPIWMTQFVVAMKIGEPGEAPEIVG